MEASDPARSAASKVLHSLRNCLVCLDNRPGSKPKDIQKSKPIFSKDIWDVIVIKSREIMHKVRCPCSLCMGHRELTPQSIMVHLAGDPDQEHAQKQRAKTFPCPHCSETPMKLRALDRHLLSHSRKRGLEEEEVAEAEEDAEEEDQEKIPCPSEENIKEAVDMFVQSAVQMVGLGQLSGKGYTAVVRALREAAKIIGDHLPQFLPLSIPGLASVADVEIPKHTKLKVNFFVCSNHFFFGLQQPFCFPHTRGRSKRG